eukprot:5035554-Prymnesium_polylepis.1
MRLRVDLFDVRSTADMRDEIRETAAAEGQELPPNAAFEILRADGTPEMVSGTTPLATIQAARAVTVFRGVQEAITVATITAEEEESNCGRDPQTHTCHAILCVATLGTWLPCWISYCCCNSRTGACCRNPQDTCLGGETSGKAGDANITSSFGIDTELRDKVTGHAPGRCV